MFFLFLAKFFCIFLIQLIIFYNINFVNLFLESIEINREYFLNYLYSYNNEIASWNYIYWNKDNLTIYDYYRTAYWCVITKLLIAKTVLHGTDITSYKDFFKSVIINLDFNGLTWFYTDLLKFWEQQRYAVHALKTCVNPSYKTLIETGDLSYSELKLLVHNLTIMVLQSEHDIGRYYNNYPKWQTPFRDLNNFLPGIIWDPCYNLELLIINYDIFFSFVLSYLILSLFIFLLYNLYQKKNKDILLTNKNKEIFFLSLLFFICYIWIIFYNILDYMKIYSMLFIDEIPLFFYLTDFNYFNPDCLISRDVYKDNYFFRYTWLHPKAIIISTWFYEFNIIILCYLLIILIFLILFIYSCFFIFFKYRINYYDYTILILSTFIGMFLLITTLNYLFLYLSLELLALISYVLIIFNRTSYFAALAGLRYFLFGNISTIFLLLGISFLYLYTGMLNFNQILLIFYYKNSDNWLILPLLCIFISFCFKLSIIPFHIWIKSVYEGTNILTLCYLTTILKYSYYIIFLKLFYQFLFVELFYYLFLFFGFLSIIGGSLIVLRQYKVKLFLGYSSIIHSGFFLIGLCTNNVEGLVGVNMYIFNTLINYFNLWLIFFFYKVLNYFKKITY